MNPLLALYLNEPSPDTLIDLPVTGSGFSQINLPLAKGDVLAISVDGKIQTPQDQFKLTVRKAPPPPNDNFVNRISLLNGLGIGSNEGASWESGEPYEDSDSRSSSIWWQLTPASTGWHTIRARVAVTNAVPAWTFPGFLKVYTGSDVAALQLIEANWFYDDGPDFPAYYLWAGTNYSIQVNEFQGRFGEVTLTAQYHPSPTNDDFVNAAVIPSGIDYTVRASTLWATAEPDEPLLDYPFISVWWRMVAASNGLYAVAPDPMIGDVFSVYRGETLLELTAVENLRSGPTGFVFEASQGDTYYIAAQTPFPGYPLLFQIFPVAPRADHNFDPVIRLR